MSDLTDLVVYYKGLKSKVAIPENFCRGIIFKAQHDGIPDTDIKKFFYKVAKTGADPVMEQIYLTPSRGRGQITFSYHFLLKKAHETGAFAGMDVVTTGEGDKMLSVATIRRVVQGQVVKFSYNAPFPENAKKGNPIWRSRPKSMLEKCAVAGALRWSFSDHLTGYFIKEEMLESNEDKTTAPIEVNPNSVETIEKESELRRQMELVAGNLLIERGNEKIHKAVMEFLSKDQPLGRNKEVAR